MNGWVLLAYGLAVVFNIGIVGAIRLKAYKGGVAWLTSGRFATVAVFLLCFGQSLVIGRFEALQDPQTLADIIQRACELTMATVGTHTVAKTGKQAKEALTK